jgi:flagellar motor component MotA
LIIFLEKEVFSMLTPEIIQRINELARKQRTTSLNELEQAEQTQLRRLYIEQIKTNVRTQLDGAVQRPAHVHGPGCSCERTH